MPIKKDQLIKDALTLPPSDIADVIEQLLKSLDQPDPTIDALWKKKVEGRIDAYDKGLISSLIHPE